MSQAETIPRPSPAAAPADPEGKAPPARPELSAAKQALREARLRGLHRAAPIAPAARAEREGDAPLSFAQERLWFLERLQPGLASYVIACGVRLSGALHRPALERALGEIVRRHETLRTTFREVDGVPAQAVAPFAGFALPVEDLSALEPAAREDRVRRRTADDATRPFDLAAGPLFRPTLLRLHDEEHVLLLSMHHIVSDGWSVGVLFRELWALYGAFRDGRPSPLPPLPAQYADFAVWQREQLRGPALQRQLAYWKERLAGAPELLELPADRPRPPAPSYRGGAVPVRVPPEVVEGLRALERAEGATLYMVTLAAFALLLSRYSGSEDVVVGSPAAGRSRRDVEGLIGLFLNTIVLRTDLSGDPTFRALVRRVREGALADFGHQEVPFERLVAELQPERSLSHSPVFQVLFQLDNEAEPSASEQGLRVRTLEGPRDAARFDLALVLDAHAGGITGVLEYSADLFEPATARRLARHLERALASAAADPDRRVSEIELLDEAERARVVREWNRTGAEYPADACIHRWIEAQAARTPDAAALVFGDEVLTYRELEVRANRLAHHLVRLGAGPEARVGICIHRSAEMVVAMLAVLKAGAAYLPLDPAYPAERLAYMRADSGAPIVLAQASLRALLPADGVRIVAVDEEAERIAAEPAEAPRTAVCAGNTAYVIYTSGSTGRPKGVQVTHANAASFFAGMDARVGGTIPGTWLAVTRIGFDIHVLELLWTLARGFRVVVHPDVAAGGEGTLAREIRRHGVTHLQCTPSLASVLVAESGPEALAGLDRVLLGGEPLPAALAARITAVLPGGLVNLYGPTETTVWSTTHAVAPGGARVPIGRPIANTRAYVLDAGFRPQPAGVPGELLIGGPGVTRGYLGRPGLTAERFVPDPFASSPGSRLYRTGDRARWRDDGVLEYVGRVDAQVKVRGFRIEPGEVEFALRRYPRVAECAVVAREDRPGDLRLAAYVVADGDAPGAEALRAHLRGTLPDYMVPASFTVLPSLPRLPNGKLDRRALPAPADAAGAELDAPRDYVEARLIQLWEALLGRPGIGPGQSFFDLGGDSFLALHLFARVNRAFDCDLPVSTLFAGATVRHMADAIREQQRAAPAPPGSVVPLQPGGSRPPLFLVHSGDRNVMGYVNLVRHLGPDQPSFGVRDVGEDLGRPIERIAAEHLAAIRAVQPHGPYFLASWSFGGLVVFEMALQLQRAGEEAAFVGLLDTLSPVLFRGWPRMSDAEVLAALAGEVAEEARRPFVLPADALHGVALDEQVRRVAEALHAQAAAPAGFTAAALGEAFRAVRARNGSSLAYLPADPFRGTLTLFRAMEGSPYTAAYLASRTEEERRDLGWSAHVSGTVEVHPVPGSHVMLAAEPHARVLAERMRESLAAARNPQKEQASHGVNGVGSVPSVDSVDSV